MNAEQTIRGNADHCETLKDAPPLGYLLLDKNILISLVVIIFRGFMHSAAANQQETF